MRKKSVNKLVVNLNEAGAGEKLANHLLHLLTGQKIAAVRPRVILCIGSDRYTGDALGPLVGSYLLEQGKFTVYGSLDHPVHAGNLVDTINVIRTTHVYPLIIAVDACLGKNCEVGNIEIWEGGLEAGIAVGNRLPCVGDISIIGVVNTAGGLGYLDLQTTPLSIVVKLSKIIGWALASTLGSLAAGDAAAVISRHQW